MPSNPSKRPARAFMLAPLMGLASARRMWRGIGAAFMLVCATGAAWGEELVLSHQWPTSDLRHQVAQLMADEVARADVGLDIRIHPAGSLLEPDEQYGALAGGTLDLALMPLAYEAGARPAFGLTILPGLVRNHAHASRVASSPFMAEIETQLAEDGIETLVHGFLAGGFAARRGCVTEPGDARGLRVRASAGGVLADTLGAAGATIVPVPTLDLYEAFQNGSIDVANTMSASSSRDRLFEQVSCYTAPGETAPSVVYQPLLVGKKALKGLDDAQRAALYAAAEEATAFYRDEAARQDRISTEAYREAGVSIREMLPEEFEQWRALARASAERALAERTDRDRLVKLAFSIE